MRGLCGGNFPNGNKFIRRIYELRVTSYEFFFTTQRENRMSKIENLSKLRPDAAGADEAPFGGRFKNGKQAGHHQQQSPQRVVADNDAGDEAKRPDDAARHAPVAVQIGLEELAHTENVARCAPKAKSCPRVPAAAY